MSVRLDVLEARLDALEKLVKAGTARDGAAALAAMKAQLPLRTGALSKRVTIQALAEAKARKIAAPAMAALAKLDATLARIEADDRLRYTLPLRYTPPALR